MLWLFQTWTDCWQLGFPNSRLSVKTSSWSLLLSAPPPCSHCFWSRFCYSQDKVKWRDFPQKGQQCFYFPQNLPLGRQSCKKNQPINSDWSKPSRPTRSILWAWPASWKDDWDSVQVSVSSAPSWLARLILEVDTSPESAVNFFNSSWIWFLACASCKLNALSSLSTTSYSISTSWVRNCLY